MTLTEVIGANSTERDPLGDKNIHTPHTIGEMDKFSGSEVRFAPITYDGDIQMQNLFSFISSLLRNKNNFKIGNVFYCEDDIYNAEREQTI